MDSDRLDRIWALGQEEPQQVEPAADVLPLHPLMERLGTRIDRYRLLEVLGEGGMAIVYRAEQERPIRREVALKIIKLGMDTREVIARFEAERQALAMMDHPHIAKVLDGGATQAGRPYFVMELVEGVPVTTYCDERRLSISERLGLFTRICYAVEHAHTKGIIHRDLKPTNVLVGQQDGVPYPKIIDFGIAKAVNQRLTEITLHTRYQQIVGTPAYMSPEQAGLAGAEIDRRTDVYSLGILLYELLVGTTPFDTDSVHRGNSAAVQRIIREREPPRPSTKLHGLGEERTEVAGRRQTTPESLGKQVRGDLDRIVMKALEKDRRRRYPSARALGEDVQRHLDHLPILAGPRKPSYRIGKFLARRREQLILAAAISLATASIFVAWVVTRRATAVDRPNGLRPDALEKAPRVSPTAASVPPIAWWRFDETSGSVAYDSAGNNHATVFGATWTDGFVGGAVHFDGIDDVVRTPLRINQSERSAGATFCAWVYPEFKEPNEYCARWGGRHVISTDDRGKDWSILCKDEKLWRVFVGQDVRYAGLPVDVNEWQFVAAAFEPGVGVRFYKNHQKVLLPQIGYDTSANITIGDVTNPSVPGFFAGRIDEVQIYDRPLKDGDIAALAGVGSEDGIQEVRLPVGWWCYRTERPQDLINGHVGTLADTPQQTAGRFEDGFILDGVAEYLDCGSLSAYDVTEPMTVCAWVWARTLDRRIHAIVTKGDSAWRLQSTGRSAGFYCTLASGAVLAVDGRTRLDDGAWHHLAGTFDGTTGRLYMDGVLERSVRQPGTMATNDQPMWIGANSERPGQNWNGAVRDVRIYNFALEPKQIAALSDER